MSTRDNQKSAFIDSDTYKMYKLLSIETGFSINELINQGVKAGFEEVRIKSSIAADIVRKSQK